MAIQSTAYAQNRAISERQDRAAHLTWASNLPTDRRRPNELTPDGLLWRGLFVLPELVTELEYNDNIFSTDDSTQSDLILRLKPELIITKNYRSHKFNLEIKSEMNRFRDNTNENTNDIQIASDNTIQIKRGISMPLKLNYNRRHLRRSEPGNAGFSREPIAEATYEIASGLNYSFNRLNLSMLGRYKNTDFEDATSRITGNRINFSDNDRESYSAELQASYDIFARNQEVAEHSLIAKMDYKQTRFDRQSNRDNSDYGIFAGIKTRYKRLIFGRIGAGFFKQDFDQDSIESTNNLNFEADIELLVTPKTLLSFKAGRKINQSNEFDQGIIESEYELGFDHELQHDLYTGSFAALKTDDITNDARTDDTYSFGLFLRHLHSRYFTSRFEMRHKTRKSTSASNEFDQNIIMYTFTSRL